MKLDALQLLIYLLWERNGVPVDGPWGMLVWLLCCIHPNPQAAREAAILRHQQQQQQSSDERKSAAKLLLNMLCLPVLNFTMQQISCQHRQAVGVMT